jgi:hypothetical protein
MIRAKVISGIGGMCGMLGDTTEKPLPHDEPTGYSA